VTLEVPLLALGGVLVRVGTSFTGLGGGFLMLVAVRE